MSDTIAFKFSPNMNLLFNNGRLPYVMSCIKAIRTITLFTIKPVLEGVEIMKKGGTYEVPVMNEDAEAVEKAVSELKVWGIDVVNKKPTRSVVVDNLKQNVLMLLEEDDFAGALELLSAIHQLSPKKVKVNS